MTASILCFAALAGSQSNQGQHTTDRRDDYRRRGRFTGRV